MISKEVTIINAVGLHARPAALFVQTANKFDSEIYIQKGSSKVNGKSIMCIMALGVASGENIEITVEGHDEQEAMNALVNLIENKFFDK